MRTYIIETDIFDEDNNNIDNIEEDVKKDNSKNLDLCIRDLYLHMITIMYIY